MANNIPITASSKEQQIEYRRMYESIIGDREPSAPSSIAYDPSSVLLRHYQTDAIDQPEEEVDQSKEESGFFTKLSNTFNNPAQTKYYQDKANQNNSTARDAFFDFTRTIPQGFVNQNVGNILLERKELDELNFQKQYLANLKDLNRSNQTLTQALLSGDTDAYNQANEEFNIYKSIDDELRPAYLELNRDQYTKYFKDEDIDKRIQKINERIQQLNEDISVDQEDLQRWQRLLNKVDSIYKPSKEWEQNKQESWLYQIPSGLASSVPSIATSLAAYGAATLTSAAAGKVFGIPGMVTGALIGIGSQAAATILSRNDESLQEVAGKYKSEIFDFLNENNIPIGVITHEDVRNELTDLTGVDYSKATDEDVLDAMIAYDVTSRLDSVNSIMRNAKKGLQDVYNRNMALGIVDLAQTAIIIPGVGKSVSNLLKSVNPSPIVKQYVGKYLDNTIDWVLRKGHVNGANRAAILGGLKYITSPVTKTTLNGVLEGGEEAAQSVISNSAEDLDRDWYNPMEGLEMMAENSYAMFKGIAGALGISGDPALDDNKEHRDQFLVGAAVGILMGGAANMYKGVRDLNAYNDGVQFARAMAMDNITSKEDVYKYSEYAKQLLWNRKSRQAMLDGIDTQLNDNLIPEGWTVEDVRNEKQNIDDIDDIIRNNPVIKTLPDYDVYLGVALIKHQQDLLQKTINSYNSLVSPQFLSDVQRATDKVIANADGLNESHSVLLTNYFLNKYSERALSQYKKQVEKAMKIYSNSEMEDLYNDVATNLEQLHKEQKQIDQALKEQGIDSIVSSLYPRGQVKAIKDNFLRELIGKRAVREAKRQYNDISTKKSALQDAVKKYKQSVINNNAEDVIQATPTVEEDNTPSQEEPSIEPVEDTSTKPAQPESQINPTIEDKQGKKDDDDKKGPVPPAVPPVPPAASPANSSDTASQPEPFDLRDLPSYSADYTDEELNESDFTEESTPQPESNNNTSTQNPTVNADDNASDDTTSKQDNTGGFDLRNFTVAGTEEEFDETTETPVSSVKSPQPVDNPVTQKPEINTGTSDDVVNRVIEGNQNQPNSITDVDDRDLVEGTIYYNFTDDPLLSGYESGNDFNEFSSKPGNIASCTVTAFLGEPDSIYGKYNPSDRSTWDNAAIYVEFLAPDGKKYLGTMKTVEGARKLKLRLGEQLSPQEEQNLRQLRNSIIELKLRNPNATVQFKHVRQTNGIINVNRRKVTENGNTYNAAVNRNLQEIDGLHLPSDLHGLLDGDIAFAYGEGDRNGFTLAIIHNDPVRSYSLRNSINAQQVRGGYGNLFIIPAASSNPSGLQNSAIKLNEKRFSDEDETLSDLAAYAVLYSRTREGYDSAPLRQMLIFTDWEQINPGDPRFELMADKQIKLFKDDDGVQMIQLGTEIRPLAHLQNDQGLLEVKQFIMNNSHWSMDKNALREPMRNLFQSYFLHHYKNMDVNTIPNEIELATGFTITLKDLGLQKVNNWRNPLQVDTNNPGYTVLEWLIKNGKIQSDLQDQIYTKPFIYVGQPIITDNLTQPEQQLKTATEDPINSEPKFNQTAYTKQSAGSDKASEVLGTTKFDGSLTPLRNGQFRNRSDEDDSGLYVYTRNGNTLTFVPRDTSHRRLIGNKEDALDNFGEYQEVGTTNSSSHLFTTEPGVAQINLDGTIIVTKKVKGYIANQPRVESANPEPKSNQTRQTEQNGNSTVSQEVQNQVDELFSGDGMNINDLFRNIGANKISNRGQLRNFKQINTDKAVKWLKRTLGLTDEQIIVTDGVIRQFANGSAVYGVCNADCINISNMAIEGVQYHEAWHRVSLLMLTPEMRRNLYEEYRKQHPQYKHVTDKELEEAIADRFMEYMLNDKQSTLRYYLNKIFRDILRFIGINRKINPRNLNSIFQAIKYGDFSKYKLDQESVKEFKQAYIDNAAYYKVGRNNDYQPNHFPTLSDFHTTMNSLKSCLLIANGVKYISDINQLDKRKLLNMLEGLVSSNRTTTQQKEAIQEIVDHFDDWMYEMQPLLNQLGIRSIDQTEDSDFAERETTGIQNYDKASYEFDKKSNALGIVKLFFSTIPVFYYDYVQTNHGTDKVLKMFKDPITGLPAVYDYDTVATRALNRLSSVENYSDQPGADPNLSLLGRCAHLYQEDAIFAALYHRLSQVKDSNLETQILQTLKSANLNPIEVGYTTDSNGVGTFQVKDSTIKSTIRRLPVAWSNVFFNTDLVIWNEDGIHVDKDKITEIINQYNELVDDFFKNANDNKLTDTDIDIYRNGIVNLLNQIGISVDNEAVEYLLRGNRKANMIKLLSRNDSNDVHSISTIFNDILKDLTLDKPKRPVQLDSVFAKRRSDHIINTLAYAQTVSSPQNNELSVLGPNNNIFYLKTQNNYCSDLTRRLNNRDKSTLDGLNKDLYCSSSLILNTINAGSNIKLNTFINFYGDSTGDKGRQYLQLSPTEDYLTKMALTWNNHIIFPTMADKKTWNTITGCKLFNNPFRIDKGDNNVYSIYFDREALDYMYMAWLDEFNTIVQYWKTVDSIPQNKRIKNYHTANKGGLFRHFTGYYEIIDGKRKFIDLNKNIEQAIKDGNVLEVLDRIREDLFTSDRIEATERKINNNLFLELQQELDTAYNLGLIDRDTNNPKRLSNKLLDATAFNTVKGWYDSSTDQYIKDNAERFAILTMLGNHMLNTNVSKLETEKIFTGDLAYYKNTDDQIKRLGAVLSTGDNMRTQWITNDVNLIPEYRRLQSRQSYTCAIFKDNMIMSHQYDEMKRLFTYANIRNLLIEKEGLSEAEVDTLMQDQKSAESKYPFIFELASKLADKDVSAYGLDSKGRGNINQADAAVYIRPQMYKDIVRMLGEWSPEVEEAYSILESEQDWLNDPELYKRSLNTLIKALKTTYFGYRYDDQLQHNVPVFNKMAMFPLFRALATGDNREIYDRMNAVGKYKGLQPIDQIAFESAVKVGIEGGKDFYTDVKNDKINNLSDINTTQQEFRNLRRQLITDPHEHERGLFGTQVSTVAVSNIIPTRVYGEDKPAEQRRTGEQIKDQLFGTINTISNKGARQVQEQFLTDGQIDWTKTSDVLLRAARSSNMGKDMEAALQVNENKDGFTIPLSALPDSKWVETQLISEANRKAVDLELPGGAFIQMSSFGIKQIGVESSRLLNVRDDGSMDSIISINLFRHVIPNYDNLSFAQAREWLITHNLIGDNAKPIAIGYRIPTQGLSSIAALHIKDVLPANVGDMIVLPDEFTAQTGSDFDITIRCQSKSV